MLCSAINLKVSSPGAAHWLNEYTSSHEGFDIGNNICGHYLTSVKRQELD